MAPTAPPAFLDIEASGFGRHSYPIEIGFVLPDGQAWCTLVRPEPEWTHWDASAQALHGITREAALRHGRPAVDVARELNRRLRGLVVYSDGWAHDYAWMARLFDAAGRSPAFTLDHLRKVLDEPAAQAWEAARREVMASRPSLRHRASTDARMLQLTWLSLQARSQSVSGP
jgi:DNA polymerase III epsilon subunit-like protein